MQCTPHDLDTAHTYTVVSCHITDGERNVGSVGKVGGVREGDIWTLTSPTQTETFSWQEVNIKIQCNMKILG